MIGLALTGCGRPATVGTPADDIAALRAAADVTGVAMTVSVDESDDELASRIGSTDTERLRALLPVSDVLRSACHDAGIAIDSTPVTHHGRVELPCWLREQAISWTRHRHGRVPPSQDQDHCDDLQQQQGGDDATRHPVAQVG